MESLLADGQEEALCDMLHLHEDFDDNFCALSRAGSREDEEALAEGGVGVSEEYEHAGFGAPKSNLADCFSSAEAHSSHGSSGFPRERKTTQACSPLAPGREEGNVGKLEMGAGHLTNTLLQSTCARERDCPLWNEEVQGERRSGVTMTKGAGLEHGSWERMSTRVRKCVIRFDPAVIPAQAGKISFADGAPGPTLQRQKKHLPSSKNLRRSSREHNKPSTGKDVPMLQKHSHVINKRGGHVKNNPQMQKIARAGQTWWRKLLVKMRAEAKTSPINDNFAKQIDECKRLRIKSQKEVLLRFLQSSHRAKLITAGKFCSPSDTSSGFIGWTCFTIVPLSSSQFMRKLFGLFGPKRSNVSCSVWIPPLDDAPHCGVRKKHSTPKTNTLCNLFRRSGLVPAGPWPEAWEGQIPFTYKRPDIA